MDLPPPSDVPKQRLIWTIVVAVLVPILILAGCAIFVVIAIRNMFDPTPAVGYEFGSGTCQVDSRTGMALIELPVTSVQRDADWFRLESLGSNELIIVGVGDLPHNQSLETLDPAGQEALRAQLDDSDDTAGVKFEPTNVILEFRRDSRLSSTQLADLTLHWSTGEIAFVQKDVPLNLEWGANDCTIDPH